MAAVNVAEEVLAGVLQAAEHLQGGVLAAQAGPLESLRWAGALPLLLRDLRVPRIVSADALLRCESRADVRRLLSPSPWGEDEDGDDGDDDDDEDFVVERLVLLLADFLWDYEPALRRLLATGAVGQLTICSSLSERAHECYDFSKAGVADVPGARAAKTMVFEEFAAALSDSHGGKIRAQTVPVRLASPQKKTPALVEPVAGANQGDEDWDWTDDNDGGEVTTATPLQQKQPLAQAFAPVQVATPEQPNQSRQVRVVHLPLSIAPLLSKKTVSAEPSLFVLSHPTCASAFPLMLHQVEMSPFSNSTTPLPPNGTDGRPKQYTHVKDVQPEHIPNAFRRSLRLVAHLLGELLTRARLDVKERIYAMGATSLKIGHTLLRILNELEEEENSKAHLHDKQPASIIIIDRTCDLAGPCSFGVSLLDRVLALLPQSSDPNAAMQQHKHTHITEIYPMHGCDPAPPILEGDAPNISSYKSSAFVSQIAWNGGVSLAHPPNSTGEQIFRSLAFQPAKLALRDLDRRLQVVEHALVQHGKITKSSSVRKPGEKKPSTRGRDVVQRRIKSILEAGEPAGVDQSALVELGIIILEALERIESGQQDWDKCRERASRQTQLSVQNASEWIIPELADSVQRQLGASNPDLPPFVDLLTLLVQAFALSSQSPLEDFTVQMLSKVMAELLIKATTTSPGAVQTFFPDFYDQVSLYTNNIDASANIASPVKVDGDEDDWDWAEDRHNSPKAETRNQPVSTNRQIGTSLEARAIADAYALGVIERLKECGQESAQLDAAGPTPSGESLSLVAQICRAVLSSSEIEIPQLQHIVDVSEQLTRAGIDLLKSGFSRFGFGVGSNGGGSSNGGNRRILGNTQTLIVFVVGGITFEEVQEVHNVLQEMPFQVILGGTTVTNSHIILKQVFN